MMAKPSKQDRKKQGSSPNFARSPPSAKPSPHKASSNLPRMCRAGRGSDSLPSSSNQRQFGLLRRRAPSAAIFNSRMSPPCRAGAKVGQGLRCLRSTSAVCLGYHSLFYSFKFPVFRFEIPCSSHWDYLFLTTDSARGRPTVEIMVSPLNAVPKLVAVSQVDSIARGTTGRSNPLAALIARVPFLWDNRRGPSGRAACQERRGASRRTAAVLAVWSLAHSRRSFSGISI